MLLIPYKVKNPVKRFPIATLVIIAINVIVYTYTTELYHVIIREDIVDQYAFLIMGDRFLVRFFASIFLHGDIFHIFGNMLFLWVFGPPVEDRLGIPKYLLVYFAAGFAGALLQSGFDLLIRGDAALQIGASGCIMGVVGAYWYVYSWSTVCVFYWVIFIAGVFEVAALWVMGAYFLTQIVSGVMSHSARGGTAYFAHIGGAAMGLAYCLLSKVKRDSQSVSEAKAIQSEMRDLSQTPLDALETMYEADRDNLELLRAIFEQAQKWTEPKAIDRAMRLGGTGLVDKDPGIVAHYLVVLKGDISIYQPLHLLRLAGSLERSGDYVRALDIYRMIVGYYPQAVEAETAFYRMAMTFLNGFKDKNSAEACVNEMLRRYPNGQMIQFGQTLLRRIAANK